MLGVSIPPHPETNLDVVVFCYEDLVGMVRKSSPRGLKCGFPVENGQDLAMFVKVKHICWYREAENILNCWPLVAPANSNFP